MPTPVIAARDLVKKYKDFPAVDGISFEVEPGESFGLLGPNGAGKSTTMRMIGAVSTRTGGDLSILGLDRTPRVLCAPRLAWRLAFAFAKGRLPGATAAMGERMNQDLTFDGGPAARDFGWAPRPFKPVFPEPEPAA